MAKQPKYRDLFLTKMTSKGQVTIPKEVREIVGMAPGAKLSVLPWGRGVMIAPAPSGDVERLAGIFAGIRRYEGIEAEREAAELQAVREVLNLPDEWVPDPDRRERGPAVFDAKPARAVGEGRKAYRRRQGR